MFPGAVAPARWSRLDVGGLEIHIHEWGFSDAHPLFLLHGSDDSSRTFDVFAPLLSKAGYRVIAWDMRGNGESDHATIYSSRADVRDMLHVIDHFESEPVYLVGHSRGGRLALDLAAAVPHRIAKLVTIDGIPWRAGHHSLSTRPPFRDSPEFLAPWLDRRRTSWFAERTAGTIDELARRRKVNNPRLSTGWLRYVVSVNANWYRGYGWEWRNDITRTIQPLDGLGREWVEAALASLRQAEVPVLAVCGTEPEPMGAGVPSDADIALLPAGSQVALIEAGHFVHIEKPDETAAAIVDFLGPPRSRRADDR